MPNNELQELLGTRFKEHTHPTNEAVWNAIEAQLDNGKTDRAAIWFWIFNGLAATLLVGLIFEATISSTTTDESNGTHLSEGKLEKTPPAEIKESTSLKKERNTGTAELDMNDSNSKNSTGIQEDIFDNHINYSAKTSGPDLEEPKIKQFIDLSNISKIPEVDMIVTTYTGPKYREFNVDELLTKPLNYSSGAASIDQTAPTVRLALVENRKRLPIHVGCEFTYLRRQRVAVDAIGFSDSSYAPSNDGLAYNRHFEISLFSQFDFTRRFSASVGFGYSRSQFSFSDDQASSLSSSTSPEKSELNLFTVPIQTKFNFLQKNRIILSAGLTFQGEFGRIDHTEVDPTESWSITSIPPSGQESLIVKRVAIRQFAFEPYLQFSVNLTPRISSFANLGYKMYMNQEDQNLAPIGRLNYFNADIGLLFRLQ